MKKIRDAYYVHILYIEDLLEVAKGEDRKELESFIQYHRERPECSTGNFICKYDKSKHTLSVISCPTFNRLKEPIVGDSYIYYLDNMEVRKITASKTNPMIYHSKELFVHEDYKGFDVEKAKQRTKEWNAIPNLNKNKIGRLNYWTQILAENNLEV